MGIFGHLSQPQPGGPHLRENELQVLGCTCGMWPRESPVVSKHEG